MKTSVSAVAIALFGSFTILAGCSVANDEAAAEGADEQLTAGQRLVGAFQRKSTTSPAFEGLVFSSDGTFFGDVDTGIRCVRGPCPEANAHLEGRYTATRRALSLTPKAGVTPNRFYGKYKYSLTGEQLELSSKANGTVWTTQLTKAHSYCAQPSDCAVQSLIHPACVGQWTCGATEPNFCGYSCELTPVDAIWPATATKLVAQSSGGGFAPMPPPGSTCAFGQQKYSFDRATSVLTSETCVAAAAGGPLHIKSTTVTLTSADVAAIDLAMQWVKVATTDMCGADKPLLQITVTTPAGEKTYTDSFYRCDGGDRTYVDNIGAVFQAMRVAP